MTEVSVALLSNSDDSNAVGDAGFISPLCQMNCDTRAKIVLNFSGQFKYIKKHNMQKEFAITAIRLCWENVAFSRFWSQLHFFIQDTTVGSWDYEWWEKQDDSNRSIVSDNCVVLNPGTLALNSFFDRRSNTTIPTRNNPQNWRELIQTIWSCDLRGSMLSWPRRKCCWWHWYCFKVLRSSGNQTEKARKPRRQICF